MADRRRAGLLASAAAGDEVAFQQIIVEHHDDMRRVAKYITRDRALADEATQGGVAHRLEEAWQDSELRQFVTVGRPRACMGYGGPDANG